MNEVYPGGFNAQYFVEQLKWHRLSKLIDSNAIIFTILDKFGFNSLEWESDENLKNFLNFCKYFSNSFSKESHEKLREVILCDICLCFLIMKEKFQLSEILSKLNVSTFDLNEDIKGRLGKIFI